MTTGDRWCHICGRFVLGPCHHAVSYGINYDPVVELFKRVERLEKAVFSANKKKPAKPSGRKNKKKP
jgi:hypothetical protein